MTSFIFFNQDFVVKLVKSIPKIAKRCNTSSVHKEFQHRRWLQMPGKVRAGEAESFFCSMEMDGFAVFFFGWGGGVLNL